MAIVPQLMGTAQVPPWRARSSGPHRDLTTPGTRAAIVVVAAARDGCPQAGASGAAGVCCGPELECGVLDVEVPGQAGLQLVQEPGCVPITGAGIVDDDMRRQGWQAVGDSPGVQVMDVVDVVGGQQVGADVVEVRGLGCGLQQYAAGIAQQLPGGFEHQSHDDQEGDGISAVKPRVRMMIPAAAMPLKP